MCILTRVNDDNHEYGGLANGEFVMGDMNTFGVVYMSTAGRGIVVGIVRCRHHPSHFKIKWGPPVCKYPYHWNQQQGKAECFPLRPQGTDDSQQIN